MAIEYAVIAGGCFWCIEAVFRDLIGVEWVESGYTGGHVPNPTYEQVCTGTTGHAEAVRISFIPSQISYGELLDISFTIHDPTQLNRQDNDIGTQYRSAIFPATPHQNEEAKASIQRAQINYSNSIVTTIEPLGQWYPAEDYHQNYWNSEGQKNRYCLAVIPSKLEKLYKNFPAKIKSRSH
ncbi:Peptide methionine sulfoxide reductase MsrA [Liberibacter crescens BT-1]|uniref:Peptide methionine sulfoxide reductase MsrA n=1 Tax=Liberibacter crescens (strain BT-1) TaxID=1215343 RepID=L0EW04_LIBCB|nr:peptide-methionine (S)-S-oxide reductase MsrA [Liberibacter crescens]AGA65015.1 Peptide methionine sulfoxide reductase MsrA [Liberibacter crescens BT-1]AMC13023.1 peptide methionine sulfoxide reductase [Liberibacter crescens]